MLVSPHDHFSLHERLVTTASELADWMDDVRRYADTTESEVVWRGQRDESWALSSSLSRVSDSPTMVTDDDLDQAEEQLVQEARAWVTAPPEMPRTRLEWLALLQHHSIPTRLVDFTMNALVALFFAVENDDDTEGRLFAVLIPRGDRYRLSEDSHFTIGSIPTSEVRLWTPRREISPRLASQDGAFILGRLPTTTPMRYVRDGGSLRPLVRSEVVSMMTIPVNVVSVDATPRKESRIARCLTARIHVDKASIREQLEGRSRKSRLRPPGGVRVNHAYCYPDVEGMRLYSRVWKRLERGIN